MRESRLPPGGVNLFQEIKAKCAEAEGKGVKLFKLSIGQPKGPALLSARKAAAEAVMSKEESMHEYQDNGSPGVKDFARRFVQAHVKSNLSTMEDIAFLPIPGIKPMLGLIPLACGAANGPVHVATTTKPGYPTPADWCGYLNRVDHKTFTLGPENKFLVVPDELIALFGLHNPMDLAMLNYPANPTGQITTRKFWEEICDVCSENDIRIFNDGAYAILDHSGEHCTLTDVAVNFPELSWAEAFSASKAIGNGTGWRIGAMAGSPDFIGDIARIKGNTDSGFVAFAAVGAIHAVENDRGSIDEIRSMYGHRIGLLTNVLESCGMCLAVKPGAGFFTLWKVPKRAFGQKVEDAKHFNFLMIEKTGVVGVHFHPYIRYAVVGHIEDMIDDILDAFKKAKVEY